MLDKRAEYENVRILERYTERPTEDLGSWADRVSRDTAEEAATLACEELSIQFYGCDANVANLRYTEVLVIPPKVSVVPVPPVVSEIEVPKMPRYIEEQIAYLEMRYSEAETIDEKIAIREEIDSLKKRYGIK